MFKRSSIISITSKKVMLEIIGSEHLNTIMADKNFAAGKRYVSHLVMYANKNFAVNKKKSERLLKSIKKLP